MLGSRSDGRICSDRIKNIPPLFNFSCVATCCEGPYICNSIWHHPSQPHIIKHTECFLPQPMLCITSDH
uniref:Uncharacterized protein n=1 Tax=Arundo donax TaxID=35708 RepID=A0A0A9D2B3_ARUDO